MLHTLRIQNYALIDDLEVEFASGFNVLTGETGAGKSIIVGALNLVLGARASSEAVRKGADRAKIDGIFLLDAPSPNLEAALQENDLELEAGELLLSRVVSADGRSRAYANGTMIALSVLSRIGDELVDMHGQHEHQSLLRTDRQLGLLDAHGGCANAAHKVRAVVQKLRALEREIAGLETDDREMARRHEFLKFERDEILGANLDANEEGELRSRRALITNAEQIVSWASAAYDRLYGNEDSGTSASDHLARAGREIDELAEIDPQFASLSAQLQAAQESVDAVAQELRAHTDAIEYSQRELDELNTRLSLVRDLKRKYGATVDDILAYLGKISLEIETIENRDEVLSEKQKERAASEAFALEKAKALSKKRRAAGRALGKEVTAILAELGMEHGRFDVDFEAVPLSSDGVDRIEFRLAANAGEALQPLKQVASGGEISRIMMALKSVFAEGDQIPTLIFDEIDSGVGGAVATRVAEKMKSLARFHQTISITHLPQSAVAAGAHIYVSKSTQAKRTSTNVQRVERDARVQEIARLLDGSATDVSVGHARALLGEQKSA